MVSRYCLRGSAVYRSRFLAVGVGTFKLRLLHHLALNLSACAELVTLLHSGGRAAQSIPPVVARGAVAQRHPSERAQRRTRILPRSSFGEGK